MTRDRLDELFVHCADLGIDVEWSQLGDRRRGHFDWRTGTIHLNLRLTAAQAVCTLAHELAHVVFDDQASTPAIEQRAWRYAAAMLITPSDYAIAEATAGHHISALALELEVTPRLIEAWRDWWLNIGRQLYGWAETPTVSDDPLSPPT